MGRKRKSYYKNKLHNIDYYGDGPVRTKFEYTAESFLREAGIPFHLNQVFCFTCNDFYPYEARDMPRQCARCAIPFIGERKGNMSRPDFILDFNHVLEFPYGGGLRDNDLTKLGILRIDGEPHVFNKATRIADYWIRQAFNDRGIKVFIIRNETFFEKTVQELRDIFSEIKKMMSNNELYEKYVNSKHYQELTYCPDIQGGRRKKIHHKE